MVAGRCRLLAGSVGPERVPASPDPEDADWYLPLHLRDEAGARERIAGQVVAGADVVTAPTWLTHRRALLPLGETRRAAAWTTAAVRVARDAVEVGLERREEALVRADVPEDDVRRGRPRPLVAAVLPGLDDEATVASGRLLPSDVATERDYRDQAGYLADAEPDLLLVAGQPGRDPARVAIEAAADTGLPVWAALGRPALAQDGLEAWFAWGLGLDVERFLLPPPLHERPVDGADVGWGGVGLAADELARWLKAGADVVAVLDGADARRLESLREGIDAVEREATRMELAATRRWRDHVASAAAMAPGGAGAWLGRDPDEALPDGFEWLVLPASEARYLPDDHFSLVIVDEPAKADLGRTLRRGGIVATRAPLAEQELRLASSDDREQPALFLYRHDP